jgi:hypothetical protein
MNNYVLFVFIALIAFFIVRKFIEVKTFKNKDEYLKYKEEQEFLEKDLEEGLEKFIDKNTYKFIVAGLIATVLFLVFGLFKDNILYLYILVFLITAVLFVFCFPPKDKF